MTIPDIGHCAGSGSPPAEGGVRDENEGLESGVCPACSGRFELHPSGVVSLHDAADIAEREEWPQPSDRGLPAVGETILVETVQLDDGTWQRRKARARQSDTGARRIHHSRDRYRGRLSRHGALRHQYGHEELSV